MPLVARCGGRLCWVVSGGLVPWAQVLGLGQLPEMVALSLLAFGEGGVRGGGVGRV